jgi:pimeloyl-ACP methyl ester carboxylesterase
MQIQSTTSHDGLSLTYGHSEISAEKPWLVFILPFGLEVNVAQAFFSYFEAQYNIVTWQARSILSAKGVTLAKGELSVDNHVSDLLAVLADLNIEQCQLVGYCSGAGIALAAASNHCDKFSGLILVNGEYTLLNEATCMTQYGRDIDSLLPIASTDEKTAQFILDRMQKDDGSLPEGFHMPFSQAHYLHRYSINYVSYRATDFAALAQTVKHKTFLITGEQDKQANTNSSEKIKALLPNAEIYIDPQSDHYGVVRADSNTLKIISNYLNESL